MTGKLSLDAIQTKVTDTTLVCVVQLTTIVLISTILHTHTNLTICITEGNTISHSIVHILNRKEVFIYVV